MSTTLTIEELEAKAAEVAKAREDRRRQADEAIRRRQLEEQIKLAELEPELGAQGVDFDTVFSSRTGEMVVVRAPKQVVYERFREKSISQKGVRSADILELVKGCLAYPDKKGLEDIIERTPGLLDHAFNAISKLAGDRVEALAGK